MLPGRRVREGGLCEFPAANSFAPWLADGDYPAGLQAVEAFEIDHGQDDVRRIIKGEIPWSSPASIT
jgi:hypothetical protein